MDKNISDWVIAAEKERIDLGRFHSDKLEDWRRLKGSGLPIYDFIIVHVEDIKAGDPLVSNFLNKYPRFVVYAIPNTKEMPRRYKLNLKSFEECNNFLRETINPRDCKKYTIILEDYGVGDKIGGVIISKNSEVLIEAAEGTLEKMSHGDIPLFLSCKIDLGKVGHIENKMEWFIGKNNLNMKFVRFIIDYIDLAKDIFNPHLMKGYFEFIITNNDELKFLDYKINEMYLK
ncbi:MAG: hypothetical protein PHG05_01270 [Candidatus Nanoarchaeia archaeon]|nr:hypothetical protein [Candidatus Nanoarchaeia archaeon]